jgi:hypothetical protein
MIIRGAEEIEFVKKTADKLLELEKMGRELASARNEKVSSDDLAFLYGVKINSVKLSWESIEDKIIFSSDEYFFIKRLLEIGEWYTYIVNACRDLGKRRSECKVIGEDLDIPPFGIEERVEFLEDLDRYSKRLFGRRCTWLFGEVPHEEYSESAFLNDISSCVHQLADYLREKSGRLHVEGKCAWEE